MLLSEWLGVKNRGENSQCGRKGKNSLDYNGIKYVSVGLLGLNATLAQDHACKMIPRHVS